MLISAKDIIIKSVELYKHNAKLFFEYLVAFFIPIFVSVVFGIFFGTGEDIGVALGIISFVLFIAIYIASLWISLGFIRAIADRYEGKPGMPARQGLEWAVPLLWPSIFSSILAGLAVLGGFILLVIPGIIFSIWFAFVFYAVALDETKGVDSLKYSKQLVKGRWWGVLWRLIAPVIAFGVLFFVSESLFAFATGLLTSNMTEGTPLFFATTLVLGLASSVVGLLLTPLSTAAPTILYIELKKTAQSLAPMPPAKE